MSGNRIWPLQKVSPLCCSTVKTCALSISIVYLIIYELIIARTTANYFKKDEKIGMEH